jgi:excisionase family DNA binding protein
MGAVKKEKVQTLDVNQRLWTSDEAMQFLGVKKTKFYELMATDSLPRLKIGGQIRFIPDQLLAWAKRKTV